MDSGRNNDATTLAVDRANLVQLLDLVRAGDADAPVRLLQFLLPGTRFLIQRRVGRSDVDREARSILETAIRAAEGDVSLRLEDLTGMVRRLIQQRFGTRARPGEPAPAERTTPGTEVAEGILQRVSPVQKEALRRCYVLGEPPESFLDGLNLTAEEFQAIRSRARAEFSAIKAKYAKQANVA